MTPEQKQALELRDKGLSRAEIARTMGKSEKAVKGLLERARKWVDADPTAKTAAIAVGGETPPHSYWLKTDTASVYYQTPKQDTVVDVIGMVADAFKDIPAYEPQPVDLVQDDRLTVYALYDAHIGAKCWGLETGSDDYDVKLAEEDVKNGITRLTNEIKPGGDAILVLGGDTLHADSNANETPASGHKLDVDGRHQLVLEVAIRSISWAIEHLAHNHEKVIVKVHRGNHDPHSHLVLMFALSERYRDISRVVIDRNPADYYMYRHGVNAIFTTHGDRGKPDNFIHKMADVCPFWSDCHTRVAITGHVHKFQSQRIGGAMWYSVDAFGAPDSYGAQFPGRRGFAAMKFDKEFGFKGMVYEGLRRV